MSQIITLKPLGSSWAASGISSPFLYIPCDLGAASPSTIRCVSSFGMTTLNSAGNNVGDTEGWYSPDSTNDDTIAFPAAAYESSVAALCYPFAKDKTLLWSFRSIQPSAGQALGTIFSMGDYPNLLGLGAAFKLNLNTADDMQLFSLSDAGGQTFDTIIDNGVVNDDSEYHYTLLIDGPGDNISVYVDAAEGTVGDEPGILGQLDGRSPQQYVTFFGIAAQDTGGDGTRTGITSCPSGNFRDIFLMDLTGKTIDIAEIASQLSAAPAGSIPRYLERF